MQLMQQQFGLNAQVTQAWPAEPCRRSRQYFSRAKMGWLLGLITAVFLVGGCADTGNAGIEGTGDRAIKVTGTVTSFGSVWVNGVRVTTESAEIYRDGELITEAQLQPGMVVHLTAHVSGSETSNQETLSAQRIDTETLLRGPISAVTQLDSSRSALSMLGQTLIITEDSVLDDAHPLELVPGVWITASGLMGRDGVVLGTYIESADDQASKVLTGFITALDESENRFQLAQQSVDYSQTVFVQGVAQDISDSALVRVWGQLDSAGQFQAQEVAGLPAPELGDAGHEVAVEGLISDMHNSEQFTVQGYAIDAQSAEFLRGAPDHLEIGARVSVQGTVTDNGDINAQSIYLIQPAENRLRGPVEAIDWQAGQLTVLGNTLSVDALTVYRDRGPQADRRINIQSIAEGDILDVYKRPSSIAQLGGPGVVTRLERLSDLGDVSLKGPVGEVLSSQEIRVLGIVVDLSGLDSADWQGLDSGTFVTVVGVQTGSNSMQASAITVHSHPACVAPVHLACD